VPVRYHAFLDESGQREHGPSTDRYYVVAGVIVKSQEQDRIEAELAGLKRAFFGTPDVEIKSSWLRQPSDRSRRYLRLYGLTERRLRVFVDRVYDWIVASNLTFIAGVIDKPQVQSQYVNPHYPSALGYQVFMQRYQKFLAQRHVPGHVTFDRITGASRAGTPWRTLLLRQHSRLLRHGCNYTRMDFPTVERTLDFEDSAAFGLIQVADLAAYNVFRQFRAHGTVWDSPSAQRLPVYHYFDRLLPRFHQDSSGVFAGYGVAKMPTRARHPWLAR